MTETIREYKQKYGTVWVIRYAEPSGKEEFHVKHSCRLFSQGGWYRYKFEAIKEAQHLAHVLETFKH